MGMMVLVLVPTVLFSLFFVMYVWAYCPRDLKAYTQEMWASLLDKPELVFARATPQDKLNIVQHLRARNDVSSEAYLSGKLSISLHRLHTVY